MSRFLDYCKGDYSSDKVRDYWEYLEKEGYASGTVRLAMQIAKIAMRVGSEVHTAKMRDVARSINPSDPEANLKFLQTMAVGFPEWPLANREMPKVITRDKITPKFTDNEIRLIIEGAKSGTLNNMEAAFVAVASVFGFRKMEIAQMVNTDLDFDKQLISPPIEKGSNGVVHRIPTEILHILKAHDWDIYISDTGMWTLLNSIFDKCGIEKTPGLSWHAWRRALVTHLRETAGLPEIVVSRFIGWKDKNVADGYYTRDTAELDAMVYEVHPILQMWRAA